MFKKNNRYVTRGVNEEIDIRLQLIMWSMIDKLNDEGNIELDYLQVFKLRKEGKKVIIEQSQEAPEHKETYTIEIEDLDIEEEEALGDISEEEALKEISKFYKQPKKIYNALEELEKLSKSKDSIIEVPKVENSTIIEKRKVTVPTIKRDINREGTVVNIDTNLAVRRGAGEENYVVGYLLAAQRVNVMQEIGDWYKIVYQSTIGKRIGFVEKYFIKLG